MATTSPVVDVDPAAAAGRLRRVEAHIDELRRTGRTADAEAVAFVRDVAERALAGARSRWPAHERELLTTGHAGLALGISDQTVRNWVAAGRLPAVKRGVRTMIPRDAVVAEIERSRVTPEAAAARGVQATSLAWRQELLAALPRDTVERLDALHQRREDGLRLTPDEEAEVVRLERQMADAAARHLQRVIRGDGRRDRRGRAGAA